MSNLDEIKLSKMRFFARHGVLKEEQSLGQEFVLNVSLFTNISPAGKTDKIKDTIDYEGLYTTIKSLVEGEQFNLIETLAEQVAAQLLQKYDITQVKVEVIKPNVPIKGILDSASITINRKK